MPWPGCAEVAAWGHVDIWGVGGQRGSAPGDGRACGREWRVSSPQPLPLPPLLPPSRLAAPLPLCCMLASARWIFLAVPILLPPVRAVLEPAKWLSFKPRAAGGAVAKPRRPPSRPSFDAAAAAWALSHLLSSGQPLLSPCPCQTPPDPPSQPSSGLSPSRPGHRVGKRQGHSPPLLTPPPTQSLNLHLPSHGISHFTAPQGSRQKD